MPEGPPLRRLCTTYPTAPVLMDIKSTRISGAPQSRESKAVRSMTGFRPSTWTKPMPFLENMRASISSVVLQLVKTTLFIG